MYAHGVPYADKPVPVVPAQRLEKTDDAICALEWGETLSTGGDTNAAAAMDVNAARRPLHAAAAAEALALIGHHRMQQRASDLPTRLRPPTLCAEPFPFCVQWSVYTDSKLDGMKMKEVKVRVEHELWQRDSAVRIAVD